MSEVSQINDYTAFITNDDNHIIDFLKVLPKNGSIYYLGQSQYNDPRIVVLEQDTVRNQSARIYFDLFNKRLVNVITSDNDLCNQIKQNVLELIALDKNFSYGSGGIKSISNFWENLDYISNNPSTDGFKDIFKNKPCVIVGSGPSLDKNVDILRCYKDNVVIMAAGSAIATLNKHGIVPQFVFNVDPFEIMEAYILPYVTKDTVLITSSIGSSNLIKSFPGPIVWLSSMEGYKIMESIRDVVPLHYLLLVDVSVISSVLSFATLAGCNPICFIGQDMAFESKDKIHSDGIKELDDPGKVIEVTGLDGKQYQTLEVYRELWDYLNGLVPKIKDHKIINCTESGLGIMGTEVMSLNYAARKYFYREIPKSYTINYQTIDKSKLFSKLILIKRDMIQFKTFYNLFKEYIDTLIKSNVSEVIINNEVNEWFDNVKKVNGYNTIRTYTDWIWYLSVIESDINKKVEMLIKFEYIIDLVIDMLSKQIDNFQRMVNVNES